ncbi:MAG: DUF1800 family protein, partial [Planctomycetota bacterium]
LYRQNHRVKFKTPFEFVVSALRAGGAEVEDGNAAEYLLERMGQPTYRCVDPTGYDDRAEAWLDPGVLLHRWGFALALAHDDLDGVHVPEHAQAKTSPDALFNPLTRDMVSEQTRNEADAALRRGGPAAARAVVLGSPEFQQQ